VLERPTTVSGKLSGDGLADTVGATPVPDKLIGAIGMPFEELTDRVPLAPVVLVGAKVTTMLHEPTARLLEQLPPLRVKPAPLTLTLIPFSVPGPLLVKLNV
jgi:hypothetical protein